MGCRVRGPVRIPSLRTLLEGGCLINWRFSSVIVILLVQRGGDKCLYLGYCLDWSVRF